MLKTIKRTKQMRLDELIKYVWEDDGSLFEKQATITFCTEDNKRVTFNDAGYFESLNWFDPEDLFTIEFEYEINEDTEFEKCVVIFKDKSTISTPVENNIKFIKEFYKNIKSVYALIDGKLELILEEKDND